MLFLYLGLAIAGWLIMSFTIIVGKEAGADWAWLDKIDGFTIVTTLLGGFIGLGFTIAFVIEGLSLIAAV